MKKIFAGLPYIKFIAAASAFIWTIAIATSVLGVQLQGARVTQVVNDVKLLEKEAPRPVALGDLIRHGAPVSTGTQSRGELTFDDRTITRLGANTTFSFKPGTREMNLIDGAILFQVPKGSGGATIRTAAVTAAITGTTGIGEFHPATTSHPYVFSKWLCLEGQFRLYLHNGQSVELGPGQMVTTDGNSFSTVLTFDIATLVSTSLFFTGFDRPLPSLDLIVLEEQKQLASMLFAPPTPNPLDPMRTVEVISQAIVAEEAQTPPPESPTPPVTPTPPPPTPSKFGTPSAITSPVPYLITNGTVITTDPSITTNGVTDFGKIYRGPVDDGAFSLWAFGSTSAVDTTLDFDINLENAGHFPLAAFKFTSLELAGNPTIDLTNGVTNLALISVGDISSGLPGGTLTFSGLDALLLASQDGSINLGTEITFQGIPTLFFYARGTNGDLTLASAIIGTTDLFLYAGRNITFNAGTNLILGGQFSTRSAGGNISVSESGNIAIGGSLAATSDVIAGAANGGNITFATGGSFSASDVSVGTTVEPGVTLTDGANITFDIGTGLTVNGGSLSLTINDSNGGTIGTGGNITLNTGANLTGNGDGAFFFGVFNNDGGHIGTGGNISVTTGGDLTAGSIDALIDNRNGGTIDSSANLTFNIAGALTISATTDYFTLILNAGGGHIGGDAVLDISASDGLTSGGDAFFSIINSPNGVDTLAGTIGGNATIQANVGSMSVGGLLDAVIDNSNGGSIGGNAVVNFDLSGAIDTQGDADFQIFNGTDGSSAGTIGSDATINVNAASISTGGAFDAEIDNHGGGNIVGSANINFNLAGDLTTTGDASLLISNDSGGTIGSDAVINMTANNVSTGGALNAAIDNSNGGVNTIGGNTTINVTAANITANSLLAQIDNSNGGSIGSGANVTLNVGGNLTTQGDATFQILNFDDGSGSGPGTIGSNATVNVTANNISTGGALFADIINSTGGTIGGNATINVTAANIAANTLTAQIDNTGGTIGGNAAINMNVSGSAAVTNDATVAISGNDPAGSAEININGSLNASYDVGGTFLSRIDGNGTITFNNVNAHAEVLKAGVFGANGVLNIGGGMLSADTTLKLYAPGSNGQLNFISDVTLGGNGAKILAANSITIFNGVVVTIGGSNPADVFVNFVGGVPNANYTGFGGNGNTTGTFAGEGANGPEPLSNAPPFGPASLAPINTRTRIHPRPPVTTGVINVSSSDELLALLDDFTPGRGERIRMLDSRRGRHASRSNAAAYLNAARRAMDRRTAATPAMRRLPQ